jgi:HAD superfamily hydrolase (TIGR01509 family)
MMLKAVIFDFDGVIADTEPLHFDSINMVLSKYDLEINKDEYYSNWLGYSDHDFFKIFKDQNAALKDISVHELMNQKTASYMELLNGRSVILKNVTAFVKMLINNNIAIAICSGARRKEIEQILLKGRLLKFFNLIVSADEVEVGKPDPQGFMLTLQMLTVNHPSLSIEPTDCIVIEDSHWGIEAAKVAGMHTVAITTSYNPEELGKAELIIDNLKYLTMDEMNRLCS